MANGNNKPYFLLVFQRGIRLPAIISAEIISEIYPNADGKTMNIITVNGDDMDCENVESFKMIPAEEINFNM